MKTLSNRNLPRQPKWCSSLSLFPRPSPQLFIVAREKEEIGESGDEATVAYHISHLIGDLLPVMARHISLKLVALGALSKAS